jgi:xanthine dehydrogenase accessory factor
MQDILETVSTWSRANEQIGIATVTTTWGSAPRREGAKMAFKADYAMVGSVSNGCIEAAVMYEGFLSFKRGSGHLLEYGLSNDDVIAVGLSCGGQIRVFVEPLDLQWWACLEPMVRAHDVAYTVTAIEGKQVGEKVLFDGNMTPIYQTANVPTETVLEWARLATGMTESQEIQTSEHVIFVDAHMPAPHLVIIGGAHVAIPLHTMAKTLGFRVTLVDPRSAFASPERFPQVDAILHQYPDAALSTFKLDQHTYMAVLAHDPKIDDPALLAALETDIAYIGVMSSRRAHEDRVTRLREKGIADGQLARIHTPIGLSIGSKTPEEIALSIMAQIVAVKNEKSLS